MRNSEKKIVEFFHILGLNQAETRVFLTLAKNGEMTVLQLSRLTDVPRTNLYRLLEKLKSQSLVTEIIDNFKTKIKPVSFEIIKLLVNKKSQELEDLRKILPQMSALFPQNLSIYQPDTKVMFYRGREGTRQMLWNMLKTEDEFRGYSYSTPVETVGKKFAVEWALEFNRKYIKARDLYSDSYQRSIKKHPYPKFIKWPSWESKYIPPGIINVDHQIDIYNNVVAYYDWHGAEIYGVEIYNQKVANLQKQIFDVMWKMGSKC